MIYFIIFYVVSIIAYYFLARGQEEFDNSGSAFLMFMFMFIPIINTAISIACLVIYLVNNVNWIAFVNKFFKLK
jgi:hypothetical protein